MVTFAKKLKKPVSRRKFRLSDYGPGYFISRLIVVMLLITTFFPFAMLLNMSFKSTLKISHSFFALPNPIKWVNYADAVGFVLRPVYNSLLICGISLFFILLFVSLSGYAFGRMDFKGKKLLFNMLMAVLMIPYTLLIIPNYRIVSFMGYLNDYKAMILPYVAGQQIFGIILARTFYASLPGEMFEAARIDGAGDVQSFIRIALPLSVPTLITVGVTTVVAIYNDYIWPTLVLTTGDKMKTFCQIVFNNAAGNGAPNLGLLAAAFVLGTLPLLVITLSCLKYYLRGMLEGIVKG